MASKSKANKAAAPKGGAPASKGRIGALVSGAKKLAGRIGKGAPAAKPAGKDKAKSVKAAPKAAEKVQTKGARVSAKPPAKKSVETPKPPPARAPAPEKKAAGPSRMKAKKAPPKPNYAEVAEMLRAMRKGILGELATDTKVVGETDVLSGDIYDQASTERDRELSLLLGERDRSKLLAINEALARIREGSYGECESCGEMIPLGRLKVLPFATLCIDCKAQAEQDAAREAFSGEGIGAFGGLDSETGNGGGEEA